MYYANGNAIFDFLIQHLAVWEIVVEIAFAKKLISLNFAVWIMGYSSQSNIMRSGIPLWTVYLKFAYCAQY